MVDQRGCQNPARSPIRHEQRRGGLPALLSRDGTAQQEDPQSRVYDDQLLSAATTVATPSGEFSVRKRRQLLPKRHQF